jgi:ribosomal protein S18 acetylase RimI-like enzyme
MSIGLIDIVWKSRNNRPAQGIRSVTTQPGPEQDALASADAILDNPTWHSLTGTHAHLAEGSGGARRYPVDVSPFAAVIDRPDQQAWADLGALVGAGASVTVPGSATPPPTWVAIARIEGVQLVDDGVDARADAEAVQLGAADVPDMLDLVERTKPGPFLPRTIELGRYLGIWRDGRLIAMAGERVRPPGFTEISAVCTDPDYRNQGLAARLVLAVAAAIKTRGETPIMHASATNTNAIRLYEALGFALRRHTTFATYRAPS